MDAGAPFGSVAMTGRRVDDERLEFAGAPPLVVEPVRFATRQEAAGYPVAEAILSVPGVAEVTLAPGGITVRRARGRSWTEIEEAVRYAIATALSGAGRRGPAPVPERLDDGALYDLVADLFRVEINPAVARHGGRVELVDVQDGTVVVRMQGGCQGCGMATVTLRQGIEAQLRRAFPGVRGLRDITDHASGRNPYFQGTTPEA